MSVALLLGLLASPASACDPMVMGQFEVSSDPDDTVAPLEPVLTELSVTRGQPERLGSNDGMRCFQETAGFLSLGLEQEGEGAEPADTGAYDPYDPPVGYRFRVVEGALPPELKLELSEGIWWGEYTGTDGMYLYFTWDDPPKQQQPFAAVVEVVAVDRAGNESPPLRIEVQDDAVAPSPGCAGPPGALAGCASAPGMAHGWPLLLAALGLRRRRS